MDKRFLMVVLAVVVVFVGFLVYRSMTKDDSAGTTSAEPTTHVKGNTESSVVWVEYGDFQCPACASYYPIVESVMDEYSDRVAFQFRHFPLVSIHQNAFGASRAAEAAGKQGKFWEMYDKLYQNQTAWEQLSNPNDTFLSYAKSIGLDTDQYETDFKGSAVSGAINADVAEGTAKNVTSTPTFYINGEEIETPALGSAETYFKQKLDEALAAANED